MHKLELTLTLEAPLAVGRQKPGGSVSEVERYVTGTVIRGAIAGQMLRQSGHTNTDHALGDDFAKLFTNDDAAIFTHGYPQFRQTGERCQVLPATAVSSKAKSGFKKHGNSESLDPKSLGVFDTLIDRFCTEELGLIYDPVDSEYQRVEPFSGFYGQKDENTKDENTQDETQGENTYESVSLETRLLTRVGINRRRSTAEDEILYSIEVLDEVQSSKSEGKPEKSGDKSKISTILKSYVYLSNDKLRKDLKDYLTHLKTLYLGGSRSRGLGKVSVTVSEPKPKVTDLRSRWESFNTELSDRYQKWATAFGLSTPLDSSRTFFTLDLQSEAILRDGWRRTTVISEAMLAEMLGLEERMDEIQLHGSYASYDTRSGWNAAWGLMKDVELVTTSGSVFFFSVPKAEFEEIWLPKLEQLEWLGVGDRTTEGFGQVQLCSPFHTIFQEEPV